MAFKDREVTILSRDLFRSGGVEDKLLDEFIELSQLRVNAVGQSLVEFEPLVDGVREALEARTIRIFGSNDLKSITNFYSTTEGVKTPYQGTLMERYAPIFEFVEKHGVVGVEITYQINFRDAGLIVDYDARLNKTKEGFTYSERERSLGGAFGKSFAIVTGDALVVKFKERETQAEKIK